MTLLHGFIKGVTRVSPLLALTACAGASPRPPEPPAAPEPPVAAPRPEVVAEGILDAMTGLPEGAFGRFGARAAPRVEATPPPPQVGFREPSQPVREPARDHTLGAASVAEVVLNTPAGQVTVRCPPCPEAGGGEVKGGLVDLLLEVLKPTAAALGGALAAVVIGRRRRR